MKKHILIIDDDLAILDATKLILEEAGFSVAISSTAEPLQKGTLTPMPDLILLDVLLSGVDGRELCFSLKQNSRMRHIPVILFSAHFSTKLEQSSLKCGADGFLLKPFEARVLIHAISNHIRKRAALRKK